MKLLWFEVLLHSMCFICTGKIKFQADKFLLITLFQQFCRERFSFLASLVGLVGFWFLLFLILLEGHICDFAIQSLRENFIHEKYPLKPEDLKLWFQWTGFGFLKYLECGITEWYVFWLSKGAECIQLQMSLEVFLKSGLLTFSLSLVYEVGVIVTSYWGCVFEMHKLI